MKNLISLLPILLCCKAEAQTKSDTANVRYYINKSVSKCGFDYTTPATPGDTLVMSTVFLGTSPLCYATIENQHGSLLKHIIIVAEGGVIINTGSLKLLNCTYVDVNMATQTNLPSASVTIKGVTHSVVYGYESNGMNGIYGGPGFEIRGKSSHITFNNMYIHDRGKLGKHAGYGIIIKNDPNDYQNDTSYDYPNSFSNITGHNIVETNISQDANYFGSSIGYNPYQQPQIINGVICHPRPASLDSCLMYKFYMANVGRSGFQASQMIKGNVFHDIYGYNLGYEADSSQGALIALGKPDSSIRIYNCTSVLTFQPAVYTYNYGKLTIHNCDFDSCGWARDTNGVIQSQPAYTIAVYPQANTSNSSTQFVFRNIKPCAHTNSTANIALYPGTTNNYAAGDTICNSGTVYSSGAIATYSSGCGNACIMHDSLSYDAHKYPYPDSQIVVTPQIIALYATANAVTIPTSDNSFRKWKINHFQPLYHVTQVSGYTTVFDTSYTYFTSYTPGYDTFRICNYDTTHVFFKDDFEGTAINPNWSPQSINPLAITLDTTYHESGKSSLKTSFNFSDWTVDPALQPQGKRTELHGNGTALPGDFIIDSTYWIGINTYIPHTWKTDPYNCIFMQWHGQQKPIGPGSGNSPPLCFNIAGGTDSISAFTRHDSVSLSDHGSIKLFRTKLHRGDTTKWVINLKYSYKNGFIKIWMNGVLMCDYSGGTIYHSVNQETNVGPYMKIGLYLPDWGDPGNKNQAKNHTAYYDNLKIGDWQSNFKEVAP